MTYVTPWAPYATRVARRFKEELGCPVVAGGPHVSTLHGVLEKDIDVAVLGEGEETFLELVRLWKETGRFDPADLARIRGIAYHDPDGNGPVETGARPLIRDLDTVPFPDRSMLHGQWSAKKGGIVNMMTSRGCPYNCAFCSTIHIWDRKFRFPSSEYVVSEIEYVVENYEPSEIMFFDDLYNVRKDRVIEISNMVRERGLHEGNRFRASARPNLLDDEVMEAMRAMNIRVLSIGFESGSDRVLGKLSKHGSTLEDNLRAVELARRHGMRYSSCFILGTPGETREDILQTFDFVMNNADVLEDAEFTQLSVLPSTEVWDWAVPLGISEHNLTGVVLEEEDIADMDEYLRTRWPYLNEQNIPREEIIRFLEVGRGIQGLVRRYADSRPLYAEPDAGPGPEAGDDLDRIAGSVPIAGILKAKVRRRLRRLFR
jgi:radical SAM superfamily enzyme YgiQ (UPF0313 family)